MKNNVLADPVSTLSSETLWLMTLNYVRGALDPDASDELIAEVAAKVYKQMEFLTREN